jgi:hypothetical protein
MHAGATQFVVAFILWKSALSDPTRKLPQEAVPRIGGSYDSPWQPKNSGHVYHSRSGRGSLLGEGRPTRKVNGLVIKSTYCSQYSADERQFEANLPSFLPSSLDIIGAGSSGSIESAGWLDLVVDAYFAKKEIIRMPCCDDDSSVHEDCQWNNADWKLTTRQTKIQEFRRSRVSALVN